MPRTRTVAALLAVLTFVLGLALPRALAGEDVLRTYRKQYGAKDAFLSDREEILAALVEVGTEDARTAIEWCIAKSQEALDAAMKDSEKRAAKLKPVQEEFDEILRKYCEEELRLGHPYPTRIPNWPILEKLNPLRADLQYAEKKVAEERGLRDLAVLDHGKCVDRMPQPQQDAYRSALVKGPLAAKEWATRAEVFDLLRTAQAPWVTALLLDAAANEPDPRALVPALDGLGGRDAKLVTAALVARLGDARWLVRSAALGALERSPSKEGIDAILVLAAKEEGRLRDDCLRILAALTGADVARAPDAWRQWWEAHRDAWTGPPPPRDPTKAPTPEEMAAKAAKGAKKSGFFGIETNSRRLCYVIDLSGSMTEKFVEKGKESRADMAKVELARSIRAMDDGSFFAVVMFSSDVRIWKPDMTEATKETKDAAVAWVEASSVVGATNTYGALEAAFQLGVPQKQKANDPYADPKLDTIILLSDGKPTNGKTVVPGEIRAAVREWNRRRRVTVHTIAFGKDADFDFLEGLAKDTGGQFSSL